MAFEANLDGLVGPTHHYGGHSFGNVASTGSAGQVANPRAAAQQGLAKMKALADLGYRQGVLPPQERPAVWVLRKLGFTGSDIEIVTKAAQAAPQLLASVSSASGMWVANAATVSPSADTLDGKVHFTVANLQSKFHRAIEHEQTARTLRSLFHDPTYFTVHDALPMHPVWGDEGAANHTRFTKRYGERGIELFVYGRQHWGGQIEPQHYPARQTLEAGQAVARLHGLDHRHIVYAQQNPAVIDAGVFHNDVISVGNLDVLFCHELAFLDQQATYRELDAKLGGLRVVEVPSAQVSVADAVKSYLFNSQLLDRRDGSMCIVVPEECRNTPAVWNWLQANISPDAPISQLRVFDLKQSMQNGGGPACLRLRIELTEAEAAAVLPNVWLNDALFAALNTWIEKYYRDRLTEADLVDPQLLLEVRSALDELTTLLGLGRIYPFQLN